MPLSDSETVGWVLFGIAGLAGIVTLLSVKEWRWVTASTAVSAFIIPVAIVPQLMVNAENPSEMVNFITPFFLSAYPLSIVFNLAAQSSRRIIRPDSRTGKCLTGLQMGGDIIRLILYTAWLWQYALNDHYLPWAIVLTIVVGLSIFVNIAILWYIEDQNSFVNAEKTILDDLVGKW